MPAVPLMVVFFIEGFYFPLLMLNQNLLSALGLSGRALQIDIVKKALTLVSIFLTFRFGIRALIAGQVISTFLAFILSTAVMMHKLQLRPGRLIKTVITVIFIVIICFLADDLIIDKLFTSVPVLLIVKICFIPVLYLLSALVLKVPSLKELTVLVKENLSRGRKVAGNE
jgi:O-antigen/teichoic acid export membrane protein